LVRYLAVKVDLGYVGIKKFHLNVEISKKNSKNYKLTDEERLPLEGIKKRIRKKLQKEFLWNILMLKSRLFKF